MRELMYTLITFITKIHHSILSWNNGYEGTLTDKELHFWVIGFVGMALIFVIYPLFILLSKHHVLLIAWMYVFTLMVVITFAIEIGQGYYGTGVMDFDDIVSGLTGFMIMFLIFAAIKIFFTILYKLVKKPQKREVVGNYNTPVNMMNRNNMYTNNTQRNNVSFQRTSF